VGVEALAGEIALHPGTDSPHLIDLLTMALSEDRWESFSRGSAIRRAGREGFARNVCVALGNWGNPGAIPVLTEALKDPSWLVREHAGWALSRIGS
jgi:epoxyqueuosine reductase